MIPISLVGSDSKSHDWYSFLSSESEHEQKHASLSLSLCGLLTRQAVRSPPSPRQAAERSPLGSRPPLLPYVCTVPLGFQASAWSPCLVSELAYPTEPDEPQSAIAGASNTAVTSVSVSQSTSAVSKASTSAAAATSSNPLSSVLGAGSKRIAGGVTAGLGGFIVAALVGAMM